MQFISGDSLDRVLQQSVGQLDLKTVARWGWQAADALAHRLILSWRAVADGGEARAVIAEILNRVEPL